MAQLPFLEHLQLMSKPGVIHCCRWKYVMRHGLPMMRDRAWRGQGRTSRLCKFCQGPCISGLVASVTTEVAHLLSHALRCEQPGSSSPGRRPVGWLCTLQGRARFRGRLVFGTEGIRCVSAGYVRLSDRSYFSGSVLLFVRECGVGYRSSCVPVHR